MNKFFRLMHNSSYDKRAPWASSIVNGVQYLECSVCKQSYCALGGSIEISLQEDRGVYWPDMVGCGEFPLFIVSRRVIDILEDSGVEKLPHKPVTIVGKMPKKLKELAPPEYVWVDGERCLGANIDFETAGYVNARVCSECNTLLFDVEATFERQAVRDIPIQFTPGSRSNRQLFTTNLSSTTFFCTNRIFELAGQHRFTSFRFDPIESGLNPHGPGLNYLNID